MAEEQPQSLPAELEEWLDDRATESGRDRGDVLARAVATYRLLAEAESASDAEPLDQQLASLAGRLDELETSTDDQIEDVRDRVVQVARSSADADHDHPELAERIDEVAERTEEIDAASEAELASMRRALAELDRQVEGGFDNYEAVLSTLADRADDTDGKLDTLASAVVDLRQRVAALEAANARRSAVEELQRDANRRNVSTADCENCGKQVHVGLLAAPRCPHCETPFEAVEPGSWFLGSATLTVGDRPALTGESFEAETPAEVFAEDE